MRNAMRMFLVGFMVVALTVNPAVAWHCCGGGGYSSYAPVYHGGYSGYGYGGYGGYGCDGCDYGCDGCGGCGTVAYDDCGGCGDCGSCGGCDSCGGAVVDEGVVVEHGVEVMPQEAAPQPPAEMPAQTPPAQPATPPQQPTTVELPPQPEATPPSLPADTATTPPAEAPPAEAPAEPGDLFAPETPAETPPAEAPPATEPAAPAEAPATPPADTDDLFGGEAPAETPAATEPAAPAETPAAAPAEGEKTEDTDDLFGRARDVLREAGGLDSNEMRVWVDDTGKFSVNARLIRFMDGHVRLMKETGRTTTVPLNRLSERDLEFVNRQASAQKTAATQTAQMDVQSFGLAN